MHTLLLFTRWFSEVLPRRTGSSGLRRQTTWVLCWLVTSLFTSLTAQAQVPANDNPCGAVPLSLNGSLCTVPTVGTNAGAATTTVNGTIANTCGAFNNPAPKDVWYSFTTAANGSASAGATITVTGNPAGLLRLFSASSCTGVFTQISCTSSNANNTAAPRLVTGALQPSTTYYVQVAGYSSTDTQGQFTICITDPPACGAPAILGVTFPTGTSAAVSFTAGPGNTTFTATLNGGAGGTQTIPNATSPTVFTGLTPGTTYFVSVRTECGGATLQSPFFSFTVPLLNDDPCGAITLPITSACTPTNGTTFGASTTTPIGYSNPGCALDSSPLDVWYQFTTPATGGASTSATITVGGAAAGQVRLFSGTSCGGTLTQIGCSQSANGPALPLSATTLTPNTTYYVMVAGQNDNSVRGPFTICITGAAACPDPTNLAIAGLSPTSASLSFTPSGNATSYNVTFTPQGGGATTTLTATGSPVTLSGLTSGVTYTVTLQSVCPAGVGSVLTRTFTASSAAPTNDNCAGATPISSVGIGTCGALVSGTTIGATTSVGAPAPGCAGFNNSSDVWYSIVVPASGTLQVETGPATGSLLTDTGLALYSGSCGTLTLLGCDDDSSPNGNFSLLRRTGLTPGSTVYARVWPFGQFAGGAFTICAQTDVVCPNVSNVAISSITSTSASLAFTPVPGTSVSSYTVTYTAQGGTVSVVTPNSTTSPVNLTGLIPSTVYTVTIQSNCTAGQGLPLALTFTTLAPAPANDDCAGATALPVSTTCTPVTGTTVGATASGAPVPVPTCGNGVVNDVWFALVVPANGVVQVSTGAVTGSSVTDTGLQLYSGTCGALTSVGCNDNFGTGNFSQVRATGLAPGSTVYARVWQIGGGTPGQFTLCAVTDPPCPAPTNLAITAITTTSASVAFTAPTAGTSYTVTYTPQGGTATTVTPSPTSSPVALTGLTPGTTYTVSVVSNCAPGETSAPATTTFTTTACLPPVNVAASNITTTSASISFGVGNGTSYIVTYTAQGGTTQTVTPNPTASPVALTGLTPATTYTVRIVSSCAPGQNSPAATVSFTTLALPPCNPVSNLTATAITTTSASLTFTPASAGTSYTVTYTPQGGTATTVTPAPSGSPVALAGLTPATLYTVSVVSNCGAGQTSTAATTTFTTLALPVCPPVTNVAVSSITATSASVSFVPGSGNTSYTVTYTAQGGTTQTVTPAPTASPVLLSGLLANTAYTVRVTSNCAGGTTSVPTANVTFSTLVASARQVALAKLIGVYPNPVQQVFWLEIPASLTRKTVHATLYNTLGQQVMHRTLAAAPNGVKVSFEVAALPRGVYSLHLATPEGVLIKRLVID